MIVDPVPCLKDNYSYIIACKKTNLAAVIDPSESLPIVERLKTSPYKLVAIWNTHHHFDHVGGNKELARLFPEIHVYGNQTDKGRIPCQTHFIGDGAKITLGNLEATVITNPGHTKGALSFYVHDSILFTGDTLFGAGCGRLFEGSPEDMQYSFDKLFDLPKETLVYCGHEYTESNLRFAHAVEPNNRDILDRLKNVFGSTHKNNLSIPFSLSLEKKTNPFARTDNQSVIAAVNKHTGVAHKNKAEVFGALRRWKDNF